MELDSSTDWKLVSAMRWGWWGEEELYRIGHSRTRHNNTRRTGQRCEVSIYAQGQAGQVSGSVLNSNLFVSGVGLLSAFI